jgi:hypothetical protein
VEKTENFWVIGDAESKKNELIKQIKKNGARFINCDDITVTGNNLGEKDDTIHVGYEPVAEADLPRYALLAGGVEKYVEDFFKKKDGKTTVTRDAEWILKLQAAKKYNPNAKEEPAIEL